MEDDMWRADGSFRGIAGGKEGGSGGGGKGKGKGGGPQFNRVIPKFLQKYHQGPTEPGISTKFEPAPQPPGDEDGGDADELDDVQKAAIDEYLKKKEEKIDGGEAAAVSETTDKDPERKPSEKQRIAGVGVSAVQNKKKMKRKRASEGKTVLSNKKLLSFSMDDEDA